MPVAVSVTYIPTCTWELHGKSSTVQYEPGCTAYKMHVRAICLQRTSLNVSDALRYIGCLHDCQQLLAQVVLEQYTSQAKPDTAQPYLTKDECYAGLVLLTVELPSESPYLSKGRDMDT